METAPANPRSPSEWTDARIELLRSRWAEGASASQIAGELGGVTRSAVIGKIHRCGFLAPAKKQAMTANRATRQPGWRPMVWLPPISREERLSRARERALLKLITHPQPLPATPIPEHPFQFLNITFDQLKNGLCRFPVGDEPPFLYCGQPAKVQGGSWCAHCFEITHKRAA